MRGADILGQLRGFADRAYLVEAELLRTEHDPTVVASAVYSLGHIWNLEGIPLICGFAEHAETAVRLSVACALGSFADDERSIAVLLKLVTNSDSEVRDWAVFSLGVQGAADTREIRDALLRCLDDPDEDVREEAAVGLGKRRDERVLPALMRMLDDPLKVRVAEAAAALLELPQDPESWTEADYRKALGERFGV